MGDPMRSQLARIERRAGGGGSPALAGKIRTDPAGPISLPERREEPAGIAPIL